MKKFRQQSFKIISIVLVLLIVLSVTLFATGGYNIFAKFEGTKDIYALPQEDLENSYCYGEVYLIYDAISQVVDRNGNVISREYVVPMGQEEFMVLSLPEKYIEAAEVLMAESKAYLKGERELEPDSLFYVSGKVVKQDDELLRDYQAYFEYDKMSEEEQALCLPYVWTVGRMGNVSNDFVYIGGIIAIVSIIAAVVIFIKWATYGYQKELKNKKHKGIAAAVLAKTKPVRERMYVSADVVIFQEGAKTRLIPADKIEDTEIGRDILGQYLKIKLTKGARKLHTDDAEFLTAFLQKTYHLDKKKQQREEYKSILEK